MRFVLFSIILVFLFTQCSFAQDFFEEDILGDKSIIKISPFKDESVAAGFQSYQIFPDTIIGHAVVIKKSYYVIDHIKNTIVEDKDYYYVDGFHSESIIEVMKKTETQMWDCSEVQINSFIQLSKSLTNGTAKEEELRASYKSVKKLLKNKGGLPERVQTFNYKWFVGLQKFDDIDLRIDPSEIYGNYVSVRF